MTCHALRRTVGIARDLLLVAWLVTAPSSASAGETPILSPRWTVPLGNGGDCDTHLPAHPHEQIRGQVQHDDAGNIHVYANGVLRSYTRDGIARWSAPPCPGCTGPDERGGLTPFVATPAGDVWALEARAGANGIGVTGYAALHHLAPDGSIVQTLPLSGTPFAAVDTVLRADADGAVLLAMDNHVLRVMRMRDGQLDHASLPLPSDRDISYVSDAMLVDGGALLVAVGSEDFLICPGTPWCGSHDLALLRLSAAGTLDWRHDLTAGHNALVFAPTGSAHVVQDRGALVTVDAQGHLVHTILPANAGIGDVYGLAAPLDGHLLLPSDGLLSLSLDGQPAGRVAPDAGPQAYPWQYLLAQPSSAGFVVPLSMDAHCHAAAVYAPVSLEARHRLHIDGTTCVNDPAAFEVPTTSNRIATTDDGGITLLRIECDGSDDPTLLARFGLPGTPEGDLLLRDDFEVSQP